MGPRGKGVKMKDAFYLGAVDRKGYTYPFYFEQFRVQRQTVTSGMGRLKLVTTQKKRYLVWRFCLISTLVMPLGTRTVTPIKSRIGGVYLAYFDTWGYGRLSLGIPPCCFALCPISPLVFILITDVWCGRVPVDPEIFNGQSIFFSPHWSFRSTVIII